MSFTATRPRGTLRRDFDWALSLLSLAGALSCTWLLADDAAAAAGGQVLPPIGVLSSTSGEVRRRPVGTLAWNELDRGAPVSEFDSIFVPPGSGAGFTFEDGSHLDVEENSLVVIERVASETGARTQVQLVRGSASGVSGTGGLDLRAGEWVTALPPRSGAMIDVRPGQQPRVAVFAGTARLKTGGKEQTLQERQAADLGADGALRSASFPVALSSPARGAKIYFQHTPPPIELRWARSEESNLAVELASDRAFSQIVVSAPAAEATHHFQPQQAGTIWWRVVGSDGVPRSELRRLEVVEDLAPIATSPRNDEQIDTAARSITFTWSIVQNAPAYQVELSNKEDFSAVVFSARTESNRLIVREPLPEGPYRWRVRTVDPERGESPFSELQTFLLIDAPLPDTPELIDSNLEVTGGKQKR